MLEYAANQQLPIMLGNDQPQVLDARRWWLRRKLGLWYLATDDEWDGLIDWPTFPEHVQMGQILRIEARLDTASDE